LSRNEEENVSDASYITPVDERVVYSNTLVVLPGKSMDLPTGDAAREMLCVVAGKAVMVSDSGSEEIGSLTWLAIDGFRQVVGSQESGATCVVMGLDKKQQQETNVEGL
jgi:hypothetical protein